MISNYQTFNIRLPLNSSQNKGTINENVCEVDMTRDVRCSMFKMKSYRVRRST